jgi:hypothetical protein
LKEDIKWKKQYLYFMLLMMDMPSL